MIEYSLTHYPGPGAGKGTQCEKLTAEFHVKHLSAGELLREEQMKDTDNGRLIDSHMREGRIVPVAVSLSLLRQAIVKHNWNRYLIDGFPRNWDNLEGWNKEMSDLCEVESVLFIECDETQLEQRILRRGLTSGRDDDNLASARKRFATFRSQTMPVVEHFRRQLGDRVVTVNGDVDPEEVYRSLRKSVLANVEKEIVQLTELAVRSVDGDSATRVTEEKVLLKDDTAIINYSVVGDNEVSLEIPSYRQFRSNCGR